MAFNLSDYETVKARKIRFYAQFPDGRIMVTLINQDHLEMALVKAAVYTNADDQYKSCPRGQGYALELRAKEKSIGSNGKPYESVNFSSWTENAEESAVGRALDNAGFASNMHCSIEEMKIAERNKLALSEDPKEDDDKKENKKEDDKEKEEKESVFIFKHGQWKDKAIESIPRPKLVEWLSYFKKVAKDPKSKVSPDMFNTLDIVHDYLEMTKPKE